MQEEQTTSALLAMEPEERHALLAPQITGTSTGALTTSGAMAPLTPDALDAAAAKLFLEQVQRSIQTVNTVAIHNPNPSEALELLQDVHGSFLVHLNSLQQIVEDRMMVATSRRIEEFCQEHQLQTVGSEIGSGSGSDLGPLADIHSGDKSIGSSSSGSNPPQQQPVPPPAVAASQEALFFRGLELKKMNVALKFIEIEVLKTKSATFTNLRDVATGATAFKVALEFAEKTNATETLLLQELQAFRALHKELLALQQPNEISGWGENSSGKMVVQHQQQKNVLTELSEAQLMAVNLEMQQLGPLHFAKSSMTLCVLLGKCKKHHDAAKKANRAILLLRSVVSEQEVAPSKDKKGGKKQPQQQQEQQPNQGHGPTEAQQLLVGALFNLGTQIELCGRAEEASLYFSDAADLGKMYLGAQHPLTKQLLKITARGSKPQTVPSRSAQAQVITAAPARNNNVESGAVSGRTTREPSVADPVLAQRRRSTSARGRSSSKQRSPSRTVPNDGGITLPPAAGAQQRRPMTHQHAATARSLSKQSDKHAAGLGLNAVKKNNAAPLLPPSAARPPQSAPNSARQHPTQRRLQSQGPPVGAHHRLPALDAPSTPKKQTTTTSSNAAPSTLNMLGGVALLDPVEDLSGMTPPPRSMSSPSRFQQGAGTEKVAWGTPTPLEKKGSEGGGGSASVSASLDAKQPAPAGQTIDLTAALKEQQQLGDAAEMRGSQTLRTTTTSTAAAGAATTTTATTSARVSPTLGNSVRSHGSKKLNLTQYEEDVAARTSKHQAMFFDWMKGMTDKLYSDYADRDRSAAIIQRAWRSAQARLETHNRRQVFYHFLHEEQKAATQCIIARWKTYSNSKKLQIKIKQHREEQTARCELERRQHEAAKMVVKNFRIYLKKKNFEHNMMRQLQLVQEGKLRQYESAAIIIQRWWPIVVEERKYWRRRNEEIRLQRIEEERRRKHDEAATNIARVWRGCMGRRYAKRAREALLEKQRQLRRKIAESVDVVRIVLKEFKARKNRLEREALRNEVLRVDAAAKIQQSWGACLRRRGTKLVAERARHLNRCAGIVQRCYKRYRARRDLRVLKTINRTTDLIRIENEHKRHRASITIQCCIRIALAKMAKKRIMASMGRQILLSTWTIQRLGRAFLGRQELRHDQLLREQLVRDAIALALSVRNQRISLVQSLLRTRFSTGIKLKKIYDIEAEELLIQRRAKREMRDDRYATKIQKVARGHLGRNKAKRVAAEVETEKQRILAALLKIQCLFRVGLAKNKMTRRRVEKMKWADKKRLHEEVQNELFLQRAAELDALRVDERRKISQLQETRFLTLCHQFGKNYASPSVTSGRAQEQPELSGEETVEAVAQKFVQESFAHVLGEDVAARVSPTPAAAAATALKDEVPAAPSAEPAVVNTTATSQLPLPPTTSSDADDSEEDDDDDGIYD